MDRPHTNSNLFSPDSAGGGVGTLSQKSCPPQILVVDDDPDNLQLTCYVVESAGYGVTRAMTGDRAVVLARQIAFDLILLDIVLPDLDGFAVLQQVRQSSLHPAVPVIAITALAHQREKAQIVKAGFNSYLSKPYDIEALELLLSQYCPACPIVPI